MMKRQGQL